jgi:hypothetical protein
MKTKDTVVSGDLATLGAKWAGSLSFPLLIVAFVALSTLIAPPAPAAPGDRWAVLRSLLEAR